MLHKDCPGHFSNDGRLEALFGILFEVGLERVYERRLAGALSADDVDVFRFEGSFHGER